ncbi:hypothetical protein PHLCEN_2v711 [Hermanssonia centrifuga]|uniref:WSC domain-containing protein n=1 Tax=Hermanssonia centrifuga TaxID=98765 RepID=A0A2R6S5E6_9APHY|nr:hypothetical protein PHLCEN_2v711 [Hermanssonia centrifuga]
MFSFSKLSASMALLAAAPYVSASSHMIMGGLSPIAYERVDSIVNPGTVSSHVHGIMGANNFNQNSNYSSLRDAECTSVPFQTVDHSAYWAPSVYYQDQNNHSFSLMPSTFNIYYFFDRNGPNETVHAFPEGLKMLAGSPVRDTYNASNFADQAVSFVCLDYSGAVSSNPAYAERQDINFPNVNACEDGIRYQVFFPMCWDGVNLDSADHKSHMAYPVDNYNSGTCPSSHPVHLVGLFFEMLIPVSGYNYWGQGAYVLASGDPTGLAFHGDFQNGWDVDVLQDAVDNCHNMNGDINLCQVLVPYIDEVQAGACTLDSEVVNENVGLNGSPLAALPGCNPVRTDFSTPATCPNAAAVPNFQPTTPPLSAGWADVGCIAEGTNGRALTGATMSAHNMTLNVCAGFCQSKGFKLAGVEFGDECYCGNSFSNGASATTVPSDQCSTGCAANSLYAKCGGPNRLELLQFGGTPAVSSSVAVASSSAASVPASTVVVPSSVVPSSAASTASVDTSGIASSIIASASSVVPSVASSIVASASAVSSPVVASASVSSIASAPGVSSPASVPVAPTSTQILLQQTSSAAAPVSTASAGTWVASGCSVDGPARALTGFSYTDSNLTTASCIATCASKGFYIAGVEFSSECYCGNSFSNNLGQLQTDNHCYMSCSGDMSTNCGGTWSMNIFKKQTAAKRSKHFGRQHHRLSNSF